MAVPMTKADVIARFNALVRDQITPNLGSAPAYYGTVPSAPNTYISQNNDLGDRAEPGIDDTHFSLAQADNGAQVANSIFNLLHNFAMSYTRVRQARWIYVSGTTASQGTMMLTALKPHLTVYFDLPDLPPITGQPASAADIDDFLSILSSRVNYIRTTANHMHIYYGTPTCHSSCHVACHGSRGRR